ncbi:MAG: hypothetical protein LUG87_02020 [Oscillospiraceae bacterium]|nr:hypothetical protein [Oscillospiraceae bacterium]
MKKSNFVALVLVTIGGLFFALGICMALLPEWGLYRQGIVCGCIGLAVLLAALLVWRRMEGKPPVRICARTLGAGAVGVLGALMLGVGLCLCMVFDKMVPGLAAGVVGIVRLLMLIPLLKGVR